MGRVAGHKLMGLVGASDSKWTERLASPRSPNTGQVSLTGDSKLSVGVNVSEHGCLSLYISPVPDWRPVQGVPSLHPVIAGIGTSPPMTLYRISSDS